MFGKRLQEDLIDSEPDIGNEIEYKTPDQKRLKRQGQAYEEADREDREDGECYTSDYAGTCKDILQL